MAKVIASTYEIVDHIGAGGGGDVYLANHIRLNKKVVLKADKRKITTRPELLRREVDVLKNLSHTYIPKVYDFFVEDDIVYTAMDFIDGESLDKPLKRGERFPQSQVIRWTRQLLQALDYLHSPTHGEPPRGFVHSDIKPANLMRTPYDDICLIDFNISLALGEENFVGYSAGYASPEHYGLDYSVGLENTVTNSRRRTRQVTDTSRPSVSGNKTVVPDVRSDIFSTGAVMYHLLSGKRPADSALEVEPLSANEFSIQLIEIIKKAMQPNPDLRFQSAAEMLDALDHLHENDPRIKRKKRTLVISEACLLVTLVAGVFASFVGLKRLQATEQSLKNAEYATAAMLDGNRELALEHALMAFPEDEGIFGPSYSAKAEYSLTEALDVYNGAAGYKSYGVLPLNYEAMDVSVSPDGSTFLCVCSGEAVVIDSQSMDVIVRFPMDESALSQAKYVGEEKIIFAGKDSLTMYDLRKEKVLWKGEPATAIAVSADNSTVAGVWRDNTHAVVYDALDGSEKAKIDFGGRKQSVSVNDRFVDPKDNLFEINAEGDRLAVSFSDGTLSVYAIGETVDECPIFSEASDYFHFEGGFSKQYLAFSAANEEGSAFAIIDCSEWMQTGGFQSSDFYSVVADEDGIYVQTDNLLVKMDPVTGDNTALIENNDIIDSYAINGNIVMITVDGEVRIYRDGAMVTSLVSKDKYRTIAVNDSFALASSPDSNRVRVLHYDPAEDNIVFRYDRGYLHDEARISSDNRLMLFRYDGFRIYDREGVMVAEVTLPDSDMVYDQQFRRTSDGNYLEVIYYSGRVLRYSAEDGSVVSDEQGDKPDDSLEEEFITDKLRFVSPLHGSPKVYSVSDGKLVAELDEDAYLAYVSQLGDRYIAQYIAVNEDSYYGILMNENCEPLAKMRNLNDIYDGNAVFDDHNGNIRISRVYRLNELLDIAREQKGEEK